MSIVNLAILPPTLSTSYCFSSWQQLANDIVGGAVVQFEVSGATVVLRQNSTPAAADRDKIWFNTDTGRFLRYEGSIGAWVADHPTPPDDGRVILFTGDAGSVDTLDGGSSGAVALTSGPFWEIATEFANRFPVGVGTFPLSGTVVGVTGTGGVDQTTIAQANLPNITLSVTTAIVGATGVGSPEDVVGATYGSTALAGSGRVVDSTSSDFTGRYYTQGRTEALGTGANLTILPPYIGTFFIRRTARKFYTN